MSLYQASENTILFINEKTPDCELIVKEIKDKTNFLIEEVSPNDLLMSATGGYQAIIVNLESINKTRNLMKVAQYSQGKESIPIILVYQSDLVEKTGKRAFANCYTVYRDANLDYLHQIVRTLNHVKENALINYEKQEVKKVNATRLSKKILVIDADDDERHNICELLKDCAEHNYTILESGSLADALGKFHSVAVDCILLDIENNGESTEEFVCDVLDSNLREMAPIIALCNSEDPEVSTQLKKTFSDCLSKPHLDSYWLSFAIKYSLEKKVILSSFHEVKTTKKYIDTHDTLTGLYNNREFIKAIHQEIKHAKQLKTEFGLIHFGIDDFKTVNELLGHNGGDTILKEMAKRIKKIITRKSTMIARFRGDEIAFLIRDLSKPNELKNTSQLVLELFQEPFIINEKEYFISLSAGVVKYPKDGQTPDELLKNTDAALELAKSKGKNRIEFYNLRTCVNIMQSNQLIHDVRRSIKHDNDVSLVAQARYRYSDKSIVGAEVLARWEHPELGCIMPGTFLPIVDQSGLSDLFDYNNIEASLIYLEEIEQKIPIAVNLTKSYFMSEKINSDVIAFKIKYKDLVESLTLELPNSIAYCDHEVVKKKIAVLKDIGFKVAIDDFGSDIKHLDFFNNIPIDFVILDGSIVNEIIENDKKRELAKVIISLAADNGFKVVGENIETEEQARLVDELGCHEHQGFFYSKLQTLTDLQGFLKEAIN